MAKERELDVVIGWDTGPKMNLPGAVILILRHLPLREATAGKAPSETAVVLTPEQADRLSEDLARARHRSDPERNTPSQ